MTLLTKLPRRRRSVTAAAAARVVQHSSTGLSFRPREEVIPAVDAVEAGFQARAASSHHRVSRRSR
jgi:hypothetical protein